MFLSEYLNDDGWVYICKTGMLDPSGDGGNPLTSTPNMEVIYQVWGRLMYVRGFQLISGIQHAILQIWVCMRKGYANERVWEKWVWLGECVGGVENSIRYRTDVFLWVVDVWLCVDGISPILFEYMNKPKWMDSKDSSSLEHTYHVYTMHQYPCLYIACYCYMISWWYAMAQSNPSLHIYCIRDQVWNFTLCKLSWFMMWFVISDT